MDLAGLRKEKPKMIERRVDCSVAEVGEKLLVICWFLEKRLFNHFVPLAYVVENEEARPRLEADHHGFLNHAVVIGERILGLVEKGRLVDH